jgi:WD40 repeat protein
MRCSLAVLLALTVVVPAPAQVAEVRSPDQRLIASAADKSVSISDAATGKELLRVQAHKDKVTALAFTPDGRGLLSGSADKTVMRCDVATGKLLWKLQAGNAVTGLKCSADGKKVTIELGNQSRQEVDPATGKLLRVIMD